MIDTTFTIGITGNIATGKSVIRRMLANAGVLGIDADVLANRMLYPGGPAYQHVIETFGPDTIGTNNLISNKKLGEIVFTDPERLRQLESLVHPPVIKAIIGRIKAARRPVAAVEAIKLLESGLDKYCDSVWVSHASLDHQLQRLLKTRGLTEQEALTRIEAQTPQLTKLSRADVMINTETSFKDTWIRTQTALNDTIQSPEINAPLYIKSSEDWSVKTINQIPISQIESAWEALAKEDPTTVYAYLGLNSVLPILEKDQIRAFAICDEWNFSATLKKIVPFDFLQNQPGLVFDAFENFARINQFEILLVSDKLTPVPDGYPSHFGFEQLQVDQLTYPAWHTAAQKAASGEGSSVWLKVLAQPFEMEQKSIIQ